MKLFHSLRARLIVLVTLAVTPALALLAFNTWNSQRLQAQSAYVEVAQFAALIATQHERLLASTFELMRTLMLTEELRNPEPQRCTSFLRQVTRQPSVYAGFARLDASGKVLCSTLPETWRIALPVGATVRDGARDEAFHIEPIVKTPRSGQAISVVTRQVLGPDGAPTGYLVAAVGLDWLRDQFGVADLPPQSTVLVLDRSGQLLMRYPDAEGWVGRNIADQPLGRIFLDGRHKVTEAEGLDDIRRIYGFHALGRADGAMLAVGIPADAALHSARQLRDYNIAAILVALLGVALATSFASRGLVLRWTDRMLTAARKVTAGHYGARVGGPYDDGELGELAGTFDGMLDEVARREGELQAREEWFRSVVQHSTDMIAIVDDASRLIYLSPAAERVLGYQPDRLKGTSLISMVHPDERTRFGEVFKYLAAQPNRVAAAEHRLRHAEGHYVSMESIGVNLLGNPAVKGIVVNSRDVTRRRRIEEMLRLVTSAVDQSQDGVLITTAATSAPEPEIVYANPALLQLTGYEEHELIGATPEIFRGEGVAETVLQKIGICLNTGEDSRLELVNTAKDGRQYPMSLQIAPLKDDNGRITHFVLMCRDITDERHAEAERERLEATLRQALKMEAVGTLAGGIAHDFNNVLLPMMMLTQLTIGRLPQDSRERLDLMRVLSAQKRAKALVGQILAFSRGSSGEYVDLDLVAICRETLHLLRATLPTTVTLVEELGESARVRADPTQVQQVLMNLCSNAAQAMPSGKGTITVRLDEVVLDYGELPEGLGPGRYSRLVVADDGSGIPPGIVERIFDPFFTTKEVGVGTGLGLSVVHGIVAAHHGAIAVDSEPGVGTAFTILLPIPADMTAAEEELRASA